MTPSSASVAATFCATLVDEWARSGIRDAVVAPGSRSAPMALALDADARIRVHVFHDERAAGFCALGVGLASGQPAVVLTTSGTAATHLHAAVVEAHQARVPLIVVTADRPPELRDVGAPQTIDQNQLYGNAVRWFVDPGVPDDAARHSWRSLASRSVLSALGLPPGPVHLNLPFREPLVGAAGELPPGREAGAPWVASARPLAFVSRTIEVDEGRVLVVAGRGCDPNCVVWGWPVLADGRSGLGDAATVVAHADAVLRDEGNREALAPKVIVRLGEPPASRVVNEWLAASGAREIVVAGSWIDPSHTASAMAPVLELTRSGDEAWLAAWREVDDAAERAVASVVDDSSSVTEPRVARDVVRSLPAGAHLVLASSMPIRDVEWFAPRRSDVTVHANRGANGIDGTISTAIGVALASGAPTIALVGDLAFLHDSTALVTIADRSIDLTIVVVDNDGGGIFSFLPHLAPGAAFERLFGTPHGVPLEQLAAVHGLTTLKIEDASMIAPALEATTSTGGVWVVLARTDRAENVRIHAAINAAVADARSARHRS